MLRIYKMTPYLDEAHEEVVTVGGLLPALHQKAVGASNGQGGNLKGIYSTEQNL